MSSAPAEAPPPHPLTPRSLVLGLGGIHALVLASWYVLRPLRDEIATLDPGLIPTLWTAVFFVMLAASPLFGWAVTRFPRRTFLAGTMRLFALLLLGFTGLLHFGPPEWAIGLEIAFYIFCSVFNLFAVSVFWSFAADLLRASSAARLFGPVAACGTLGGILGSQLVSQLRESWSIAALIALAALLLEGARWGILILDRRTAASEEALTRTGTLLARDAGTQRVSGGVWEGIRAVFGSPYLLGVVIYLALANFNGSLFYTLQSSLLKEALPERAARGAFLADLNSYTNGFTLLSQLFLNAWLLKHIGVGRTLLVLPIWSILGLIALGRLQSSSAASLVLSAFAIAEVGRRAISYSLAKPTKEYLFTLVPRDEKYRSKNFIDTVVYRGSDALSSSAITWARNLGASLSAVSYGGIVPALLWASLTMGLGRRATARQASADRLSEAA